MNDLQQPNPEFNDSEQSKKIQNKIDRLTDQIWSIQEKLNEPKKENWWKKNLSLFISLIALGTSVYFTLQKIEVERQNSIETRKTKKIEQIEQLTLKLTDLAEKNINLSTINPNSNVSNASSLLNAQRSIYIRQIIDLMKGLDHSFPPDIYALIGNELRTDGQFKEALKFYRLELQHAKTSVSKVVAHRELGYLFGIANTSIYNADSATYHRKKSVVLTSLILGEQRHNYKAYSFQLWASDELYNGHPDAGMNLIDSAKSQYLKLPEDNSARQFNLRILNQMVSAVKNKWLDKVFFNLSGEWSSHSSQVKIYFNQLPNWYCNLEIYRSGKMIYNLNGPIIGTAQNHITFSVAGTKTIENNAFTDRIQTSASIMLVRDKNDEQILYLTIKELNDTPKKYTIYKR